MMKKIFCLALFLCMYHVPASDACVATCQLEREECLDNNAPDYVCNGFYQSCLSRCERADKKR